MGSLPCDQCIPCKIHISCMLFAATAAITGKAVRDLVRVVYRLVADLLTILSSRITLSESSSLSIWLSGSDRMIRVSSDWSSKCESSILALLVSGMDDDSAVGAVIGGFFLLSRNPPAAAMISKITSTADNVFLLMQGL